MPTSTSLPPQGIPTTTLPQYHHRPPNSTRRPYFIISLLSLPKSLSNIIHRRVAPGKSQFESGTSVTPKGGSMMAGFFRRKKSPFLDNPCLPNDKVLSFDAIRPTKPHLALLVPPGDNFAVCGIGHKFASKARLFRRVTWGKLKKKTVFHHPNLFRKDPGVKLLNSNVEKNERAEKRGIQRIRMVLQGQGAAARKSICQPEIRMENHVEDRKDGELELCKKRILIGHKCRPLGRSGTLRYDQNGILLPELLFP